MVWVLSHLGHEEQLYPTGPQWKWGCPQAWRTRPAPGSLPPWPMDIGLCGAVWGQLLLGPCSLPRPAAGSSSGPWGLPTPVFWLWLNQPGQWYCHCLPFPNLLPAHLSRASPQSGSGGLPGMEAASEGSHERSGVRGRPVLLRRGSAAHTASSTPHAWPFFPPVCRL